MEYSETNSKRLGAAILGTGDVSGEHIKAYQANAHCEVRAILSRDRARAQAKGREYGLANCRAYTDLDELLQAPDIDVVSICTPNHMHADMGVACAQAGKHMIVEKPIAVDPASLHKLAGAVKQAGVRTVVSFVLRWNPLFETIRSIIAQGLIGDIYYAEADYLHGITANYRLFPWMRQRAFGGSAMLTGGCHALDAVRWFVNQEAVEVFSYGNYSQGNPLDYEYEPNSVLLVKFANGTVAKVATSIEYMAPYTFPIALMGNRGVIRDNRLFTKEWPGQTGWAAIPTVLPDSGAVTHHPFLGEIDHFIECVLTGQESHCSVADAVKTHEIILGGEISIREGRPVKLPLSV